MRTAGTGGREYPGWVLRAKPPMRARGHSFSMRVATLRSIGNSYPESNHVSGGATYFQQAVMSLDETGTLSVPAQDTRMHRDIIRGELNIHCRWHQHSGVRRA